VQRSIVRWALGCLTLALAAAWCWADGGVVRAIEKDGPFQISAFTSPNPLVAGSTDISVLVQDGKTLAPVPQADVDIVITPRGKPHAPIACAATREAATNKLFRACLVELEAGWYDVVVTCRADGRRGRIGFALEVGAAGPPLATLWLWIGWPVVPLLLFGIHELASSRKPNRRGPGRAKAARHGGPGRLQ
jgi:hypothetical protein